MKAAQKNNSSSTFSISTEDPINLSILSILKIKAIKQLTILEQGNLSAELFMPITLNYDPASAQLLCTMNSLLYL